MDEPMLKQGDPCPCCGQPIKTSDPAILAMLTHICDSRVNAIEFMMYMEAMRHASGRDST